MLVSAHVMSDEEIAPSTEGPPNHYTDTKMNIKLLYCRGISLVVIEEKKKFFEIKC